MMTRPGLAVAALSLILLVGCTPQVPETEAEVESSVSGEADTDARDDSSASAETGLQASSAMPGELVLEGATIISSITVADGYQVGFETSQSQQEVAEYYRTLAGWSLTAEFAAGDAQAISIGRDNQQVVVAVSAQSSGQTTVLVTGSLVKE